MTYQDAAQALPGPAQDATWPYLRMDVLAQVASGHLEVDDVLPVLNPVAFPQALPAAASPPERPQAVSSRPTWRGVFAPRFEAARQLMATLDDIAHQRRCWQYSALRVYAALLLADHVMSLPPLVEGVGIETLNLEPSAFQAFFERETGVSLDTWYRLEDAADRTFLLSLARTLLIVILDSVRADDAHDATGELYDEYLQDVDDYLEPGDELVASVPGFPQGRAEEARTLALPILNRVPVNMNLGAFQSSSMATMSFGWPTFSSPEADEALGYVEWLGRDGRGGHRLLYVYLAREAELSFVVDLDIFNEYFDWANFDKQVLLNKSFQPGKNSGNNEGPRGGGLKFPGLTGLHAK